MTGKSAYLGNAIWGTVVVLNIWQYKFEVSLHTAMGLDTGGAFLHIQTKLQWTKKPRPIKLIRFPRKATAPIHSSSLVSYTHINTRLNFKVSSEWKFQGEFRGEFQGEFPVNFR